MNIKTVDSKTLKKWLEKNEAVVIDVREPEEHMHCHIKGSVPMSASEVNAHTLAKFKNKKLVFHCKLGKRGAMACEKVAKEDPKLHVYNLEGGIDSWKHCGFNCEMDKCGTSWCHRFGSLGLDDQVRVIFGSTVLLFIMLGYYVSDTFFWVTGVLGIAYIISGFTGICMVRNYLRGLACNKGKDGGCENMSCEVPKPATTTPSKAVSKPAVAKTKAAPKKNKGKSKGKKKR